MFGNQVQTKASTGLELEQHTKVSINALGQVEIEGVGYTGSACSILGDKLRRKFGGGGQKTDKPEAFASNSETNTINQW
jgi:hypothetical protein